MECEKQGDVLSAPTNESLNTGRVREVWKLLFAFFIDLAGAITLFTYFPIVVTDFFASEAANEDVHCSAMEKDEMPDVCHQAHTKVIFVTAGQTLISHAVVAVFASPFLGAMSDVYGRKPFILLDVCAFLIPKLFLGAYIQFNVSLYWYFAAQALCSAGRMDGVVLAFITDSVAPEQKSLFFTFRFATSSLGSMLGAGLTFSGLIGSMKSAVAFSVAVNLVSIVWIALFVSESRKPTARTTPESKTSLKGAILLLTQNRLVMSLTVCLVVVTFGGLDGGGQVLAQYLLEVSHFTSQDLAITIIIFSFSVLFSSVLVYFFNTVLKLRHTSQHILLSVHPHVIFLLGVLMICFAGLTLKSCMLAFAGIKLLAFLSLPLTTLAVVVFTTISAAMSDNVPEHQQGALQGAINAVSSLVGGVGPFLFLGIYMCFRTDFFYFPGAAMLVIAGTQLIGFFLVNSMRSFLSDNTSGNDIEMLSVAYKAVATQERVQV